MGKGIYVLVFIIWAVISIIRKASQASKGSLRPPQAVKRPQSPGQTGQIKVGPDDLAAFLKHREGQAPGAQAQSTSPTMAHAQPLSAPQQVRPPQQQVGVQQLEHFLNVRRQQAASQRPGSSTQGSRQQSARAAPSRPPAPSQRPAARSLQRAQQAPRKKKELQVRKSVAVPKGAAIAQYRSVEDALPISFGKKRTPRQKAILYSEIFGKPGGLYPSF